MYANFFKKTESIHDVEALAASQDRQVKEAYPDATFEYRDAVEREDYKTILRVADIAPNYNGIEYTLFMDLGDSVLMIVLLEPHHKQNDYLAKLKWIGRYLTPMSMKGRLS